MTSPHQQTLPACSLSMPVMVHLCTIPGDLRSHWEATKRDGFLGAFWAAPRAAHHHHSWWVYGYRMTVPDPHPSCSRPLVWWYGFMWNGRVVDGQRWHMIRYMGLCEMKLRTRSTNICWFLLMNPLHLIHEGRMVDGCDWVGVADEYLSSFSNSSSTVSLQSDNCWTALDNLMWFCHLYYNLLWIILIQHSGAA